MKKYYSDVLDKIFDTEEELEKAEKEHEEAEAKKAEAKALVKKECEVVNDAFVARNAARHTYNEKVLEARKIYNDEVKAAQEKYQKSLEEVTANKTAAEKEFDTKLAEFKNNHPEGYRLNLKDGDQVATYVVTPDVKYNVDIFDDFDRLFDSIRNIRFPW